MGYTTDFDGQFNLNKPLSPEHKVYLSKFADIRHMKRNADAKVLEKDPIRKAVGLPVGVEGEFYVNDDRCSINDHDKKGMERIGAVVDINSPASTQPGLWCQWVPNEEGTAIEWDGGEKFYSYVDWLEYLIKNFLKPWGYKLSGEVTWQGEDREDRGKIVVKNNKVGIKGRVVYE